MAILTRNEILKEIKANRLLFTPEIDQFQLQPAAVDVRVGFDFYIPKLWQITEQGREALGFHYANGKNDMLEKISLKAGQCFDLMPGEFILISTLEKIAVRSGSLVGILYSRSSTNRRGMGIESGVIDPYYEGYLMIPVFNQTRTQKISIFPGERIAQIVFERTESELTKDESLKHGGAKPKYHGQAKSSLEYQLDASTEINAIKSGKISEFKKKFQLQ